MRRLRLLGLASLIALLTTTATAAGDALELPWSRFVLPNGLTVVVSEDPKAPVVAVSVWYRVGSADEPAGRTGFAHLFEHLMFQGSEHHRDEYFHPFELAGATDMNGTTWLDRTNYYATVPTTALDMALWMESDRMGHLLGAIGQKELDEQRGVVQNEKRQGENQPYGRVYERLMKAAFPSNHPYHHPTIGSMEDLEAASLDDVRGWFRTWYGAANTTVVLAGDITPEVAREKMLRYFGDIPAGPQPVRQQPWIAPRSTSSRDTMADQVAQVRLYREWNVPGRGDEDTSRLGLAARVLGGGRTSRLYQRLVVKDRLADGVSAGVSPFVLASMFQLQVSVREGVALAAVEKAIDEEWQRFLREGPTAEELERAMTATRAALVRGLERVNGKASLLAEGQIYHGDPGFWQTSLARLEAATPEAVQASARRWIARGDHTLVVVPEGSAIKADANGPVRAAGERPEPKAVPAPEIPWRTVASEVDRSAGVPAVERFPDLAFPTIQRAKLANGMPVLLAARHDVPLVQVQLQFSGGYASDPAGKPGTAAFTMAMLDEGTEELEALEIARRAERLGAVLTTGAGLDSASAGVSALTSRLEPSLALLADVVRRPAFREGDLARVRAQWLAGIAQEKTRPTGLALRTLPPLLYGAGHPYAIPFTGSGTEASIAALTEADLRAWAGDFLRPDNVTVLVAGDITLDALLPRLEAAFGDWKPAGKARPQVEVPTVALPESARVFLIDRPGAPQSMILAGVLAPSGKAGNDLQIQTMNGAFGGSFMSRLNLNLREDKHWSYGASSFLPSAVGQRPFLMYAPVQTDKTAESMAEILREAREVIGKAPLREDEIARIKNGDVRSLPGRYQTTGAVLGALAGITLYERPDDWVQTLKARTEAQTDAQVQAAAREVIRPDALTWIVVGDLSEIEKPVRELGIGPVAIIDADGQPLPAPTTDAQETTP